MLACARGVWDEESGTEAVQRDAGVVDDEVDALGVRLLQVFCKIFDAGIVVPEFR